MKRVFTVQLSLKHRVYLLNAILLCITVIGAILMVWYTYKTEKIFKDIVDKNLVIYQSAEALSTSLVNQKGFVSYYLLDHNPEWIDKLNIYRKLFKDYLVTVKSLVKEQWEKDVVVQIESKYANYVANKDKVIAFYKSGDYEKGSILHKVVRRDYNEMLEICEKIKLFHKEKISDEITVRLV